MDKIEMKAPYSRKDIEDWVMKTSDGYLPQTYNLKALTNLIRKYNSDFVVPLQSPVTDKQVISDEELIKWAKPIENGLKVMHTFLWLSTEIANKVQSLPSVKSNHHSTLQKSIESVLNEWLKPVKQSPVSEHSSEEQEEFNQYFVELKEKSPVDGAPYVNLNPVQSSTVSERDKLISELQERAEIVEDELDKLKQCSDDWISVEDDLPEIGQEVIVYCPKSERKVTALCRFIRYEEAVNFYWDNSYGGSNVHIQEAVTHWQPLPKPPVNKKQQ